MKLLWFFFFLISSLFASQFTTNPHLPKHYTYTKKLGEYATAYTWDRESLSFARHFRMAEIGGFEDLHHFHPEGFHKKIGYFWIVGFYKDQIESNPFLSWVYLHKEHLTLNPHYTPLGGDFYFDMCNPTLQTRLVAYLKEEIEALHLDGLFFDWANEEFLFDPAYAPLKKRLQAKHPHTSYRQCLKELLARLRKLPILLITNQAYRNPELLQYVDYDATESYISTTITRKKKAYIDGRLQPLLQTKFVELQEFFDYATYLAKLRTRYSKYGFRNFIYLNYLAPKLIPTSTGYRSASPREGIIFNFALAKLFDFIPYTEVPYARKLEQHEIYFVDLKKPLGSYEEYPWGYLRHFQNGFLILCKPHAHTLSLKISQAHSCAAYDVGEQKWIETQEDTLLLKLQPTNQLRAKVFVYADQASCK